MNTDIMRIPRTPDELHTFIRDSLDVNLSRRARLAGHSSHFDYICHAFFADRLVGSKPPPVNGPLDAVVLAPRGGGKTFLGALSATLDLIFKPGIQVRIVAGSEDQGTRMLAYLRAFFAKPALMDLVEGKPGKTSVTLTNGSCVQVLAQSHSSVRGIRVHKVKCDEVELFDPDIFAAVQLTTMSGTCGEFEVRGTVDCLSTQHLVGGLMQRLVKECEEGNRTLFRWSLMDVLARCDDRYACHGCDPDGAPCPLLPECEGQAKVVVPLIHGHLAIADAIRMKARVSKDTWQAEMLCLKPGQSHAVYRDFDTNVHVVDRDPVFDASVRRQTVICGMDFGFRSPTAILWGVLEELADGSERLTIVQDYQETQRTIQEHIKVLKRYAQASHALHAPQASHMQRGSDIGLHVRAAAYPGPLAPEWIGADPAGNANTGASNLGSHIQQLRSAGFPVKAMRSELKAGLGAVRAWLAPAAGAPRLFVHKRCTQFIEAIQNYHYEPDREQSEVPEKDGWDHLCDALRYMVVNLEQGEMRTSRYA